MSDIFTEQSPEIYIPTLSHVEKAGVVVRYPFLKSIVDHSPTDEVVLLIQSVCGEDKKEVERFEFEKQFKDVPFKLGLAQLFWIERYLDTMPVWFHRYLSQNNRIEFSATVGTSKENDLYVPRFDGWNQYPRIVWYSVVSGFSWFDRVAVGRPVHKL